MLSLHLNRVARDHAAELLTRQATTHLIDEVQQASPSVVKELIPELLRVGQVQVVLQRLLEEQVSIRQLDLILETLGDRARHTSNTVQLTEFVRQRLSHRILSRLQQQCGCTLELVTLSRSFQKMVAERIEIHEDSMILKLDHGEADTIVRQLADAFSARSSKSPPLLLVDSEIRPAIRRMLSSRFSDLVVLGSREVDGYPDAEIVATIDIQLSMADST